MADAGDGVGSGSNPTMAPRGPPAFSAATFLRFRASDVVGCMLPLFMRARVSLLRWLSKLLLLLLLAVLLLVLVLDLLLLLGTFACWGVFDIFDVAFTALDAFQAFCAFLSATRACLCVDEYEELADLKFPTAALL